MNPEEIRMDTSRENLEYEMENVIEDILKEESISLDDDNLHIKGELANALTEFGISVNSDEGLRTNIYGEQLYKLTTGKHPYFLNLEKNLVRIIVGLVFSMVKYYPQKKEELITYLFSIACDIYMLYYNVIIQIKNQDYCVYMCCQLCRTPSGVISKNEIVNMLSNRICKKNHVFPGLGICEYYKNGECIITEEIIEDGLKNLCATSVLKPIGNDLYRFYK